MQVCTSLQTDNHASNPLLSILPAFWNWHKNVSSLESEFMHRLWTYEVHWMKVGGVRKSVWFSESISLNHNSEWRCIRLAKSPSWAHSKSAYRLATYGAICGLSAFTLATQSRTPSAHLALATFMTLQWQNSFVWVAECKCAAEMCHHMCL